MRNYIILFLSTYLASIIASCVHFNDDKTLKPIGTKEYINGFKGESKYKVINGVEYICHYDLNTHKKIVAESLDGSESISIDLRPAIKLANKIKAIDILDWDNIYVMPSFSTYIILINRHGIVKRKIDLSAFLEQDEHFELVCFKGEFIFNDTTMFFALDVEPQNLSKKYTDISERDKIVYRTPKFIKIDNFTKDSLTCQLWGENLYPRFSAENELTIELIKYRFVNHQIVFTSMYSDSIYLIDPNSMKIKNVIGMRSNYTDLMVNHITRDQVESSSELLISYNSFTNGYIENVIYDQLSHHYLVFVIHKPTNTVDEIISSSKFPDVGYSVIVLDSLFNQISEIKLDDEKYNPHCLSTSKGLFLASNSKHSSDLDYREKFNYTIFKYE